MNEKGILRSTGIIMYYVQRRKIHELKEDMVHGAGDGREWDMEVKEDQ